MLLFKAQKTVEVLSTYVSCFEAATISYVMYGEVFFAISLIFSTYSYVSWSENVIDQCKKHDCVFRHFCANFLYVFE